MNSLKSFTFLLLGILLLGTASGQDDPDKIGTVNMRKLLAEYYKTKETLKIFEKDKEVVVEQDKKKQETIKTLVEQTRELQAEAENASQTREKQEELFAKLVSQQREAQALQNARVSWLERKNAAFREKETIEFGKLREEIVKMVKEVGDEKGFDFIFDRSGASGANVLILAYAKDATDLTAVVIDYINKDAPKEPEDGKEDPEKKTTEGGGE